MNLKAIEIKKLHNNSFTGNNLAKNAFVLSQKPASPSLSNTLSSPSMFACQKILQSSLSSSSHSNVKLYAFRGVVI